MFYLRTFQEGEVERALKFEKLERLVFNEVDLVLTVNAHMASSLSKHFVNQNFGTLSFTFDYALTEGSMRVAHHNVHEPWIERSGILYVAADNPTNQQTLRFLCASMSKGDSRNHAQLHVYGTVPNLPECASITNVIHHGVATEEAIVAAAIKSRLFVVPCLTNVGISTKSLNSFLWASLYFQQLFVQITCQVRVRKTSQCWFCPSQNSLRACSKPMLMRSFS